MRNVIILGALVAIIATLAACNTCRTKCATENSMQPQPVHHDYKGEKM